MRSIKIRIGGVAIGEQKTWAYPAGQKLGLFRVPVYDCTVAGIDDTGKLRSEKFPVMRFGVQCKDGRSATVVGLAEQQTHTIKSWIPTYMVHSATSTENGAWQVYGNFLIHDGPDSPLELFATIGCIEVMGPRGFQRFNDLVVSLSGAAGPTRERQLSQIGSSGRMSITYERASRPTLKTSR